MEFERMSMARLEDIQRLLKQGRSVREISRVLQCRKQTVIDVKKNLLTPEHLQAVQQTHSVKVPPTWTMELDWQLIEKEVRKGFELKRIWEDYAANVTSNSNFFKYVRKRFQQLLQQTVTLREFKPGEYAEVDYAGDIIEWIDPAGVIHGAQVFVAILCYSQLVFAHATESQSKENWLHSHQRFLIELKGSPRVIVPDNLKSAVIRTHLYDPDLNPDYTEFAKHYEVAIVPARVRRPKDKALVEGAVKILSRLFRWIYRRHTFVSLQEINAALKATVDQVNHKKHTRFKCSRIDRFQQDELQHLQPLPVEPWEYSNWKTYVLHPDCTISIDKNYYSAPYQLRGKELRVKVTHSKIEIFHDLKRVALHMRSQPGRVGVRVLDLSHLPSNSRAYLEVTPQNLLSQAKFVHPKLYELIHFLFEQDALGNLRRAQGFIRKAHRMIQLYGHTTASPWIIEAVEYMMRFNQFRVRTFEELLKENQKKLKPQEDRTIVRKPGNPMLRRVGGTMGTIQISDSQIQTQE